ncbi:MbnP family protein [Flavobacterium sp.]|uniref:MbnP family protein n=1 Tax=Flavobacterium sp. TaxID=239 RepID=UPI002616DAC6|nr:MbnP family protein [Flavobacterium sp.]
MNRNHYLLIAFCLLFFSKNQAQNEKDYISFQVDLCWNSENLELNKDYISNKDTLKLDLVKFYISDLKIEYNNGSFYNEKNSYHLIDIENKKSLQFLIPRNTNKISKVIFNVGLDSTTSVSGALSDDLDVTNGMYWAWQSGYINMKIEGTSKSCKTRKNAFQFHIGGYLKPYYALRKVVLDCNDNNNNNNIGDKILLKVNLFKLFNTIDLSKNNSIMIPCEKAMKIADNSAEMYSIE